MRMAREVWGPLHGVEAVKVLRRGRDADNLRLTHLKDNYPRQALAVSASSTGAVVFGKTCPSCSPTGRLSSRLVLPTIRGTVPGCLAAPPADLPQHGSRAPR
jgi:hypothetical protein